MAKDIKAEFGRLMRLSRDAKGMSRATLALHLGISLKTIQSWEMGRTFIERLELIPRLEAALDCSLSSLIAKAMGGSAENAAQTEEPRTMATQRASSRPGPLSPRFSVLAPAAFPEGETARLEHEWVAAPLLKPGAMLTPVSELQPRDVLRHVIIPREWASRAAVVAAVRMGDSAMMPMIPLGAVVVVDVRPLPLEKALGKVAALDFAGKGLRIRRVVRDMSGERCFGAGVTEHGRGRLRLRLDKGDRILGEVIGILAALG